MKAPLVISEDDLYTLIGRLWVSNTMLQRRVAELEAKAAPAAEMPAPPVLPVA